MSITGTGVIIIILGLYGLIFNSKFLYNIVIFFIPFTATAVINVGAGDTGSAIQPFMFLGILWLINIVFIRNKFFFRNSMIIKSELYSILLLICFALITLISLIMPFIIDGKENGNVSGVLNTSNPIVFSIRNITQYFYLLYGILMAIGLYFHNRTENNYKNTLKVYSYSILFVILWGCFELFCYYFNFTYPSFIFNNSISNAAQPFDSFLQSEEATKRIISVTVEPSILVQSILLILPFFITGIINKVYIFNKYFDITFIIIIIIFVFRSTSTVGAVFLVLILLWSFIYYINELSTKNKIKLIIGFLIICPILFVSIYNIFNNIIDSILFNKTGTYSALERSSAIIDAWGTFLNHPLLGAGWGSVTSFDLFVKILSNTGILGVVFFTCFLIKLLINQIKTKTIQHNNSVYKLAIIISFCTLILSNIVSGFTFVFGFFWLGTGLMLVTNFHFIDNA